MSCSDDTKVVMTRRGITLGSKTKKTLKSNIMLFEITYLDPRSLHSRVQVQSMKKQGAIHATTIGQPLNLAYFCGLEQKKKTPPDLRN